MKFADGSEIRVEDGRYIYESNYLTIERTDLHNFLSYLVDFGILEQSHFQKNGEYNEYFGIAVTSKEVDREPEPSLEECFERVIDYLQERPVENHEEYEDQAQIVGKLTLTKNAISNRTNSDAP